MTKTVLVVEDRPIIRSTTVLLLDDAGYHVLDAPDADAAILLMKSRPDIRVVFSDSNLQ